MTPEKLQAIRDYLLKHFPSDKHADEDDFNRHARKFRIVTKDHVLLLSISESFISDNEINPMIRTLDTLRVPELLIKNPNATVVVWSIGNKGGIKVEPRT